MIASQKLIDCMLSSGVPVVGAIPFSDCRIQKKHLLHFSPKTALMFLIPYYVHTEEHNLSLYAISGDYHYYLKTLFDTLLPSLHQAFPGAIFEGFTDHSPIDERHAAAAAGLGIYGDNGLLIHKSYGTFHFIGEILTDVETDAHSHPIMQCEHCGLCKRSCPTPGDCLSAITQKKGELTPDEENLMLQYNTCWGCDCCQTCCPHNQNVAETPIHFFHQNRIPILTEEILNGMSDEVFATRAYAWRGRAVIERNLRLFASKK